MEIVTLTTSDLSQVGCAKQTNTFAVGGLYYRRDRHRLHASPELVHTANVTLIRHALHLSKNYDVI